MMECVGCSSAAVSERSELTAQGYRRFRCRACGKQFNERSAGSLNRTLYPSDVIALVVLWRLRPPACSMQQSDRGAKRDARGCLPPTIIKIVQRPLKSPPGSCMVSSTHVLTIARQGNV